MKNNNSFSCFDAKELIIAGMAIPSIVEAQVVRYAFFRKPLSTPFLVMENTALSWDSRRSILSQEVIRRGMHMHPSIPLQEKLDTYSDFEELMLNSGYSWKQIQEVMMSGLLGLEKKVSEAEKSGVNIHRSTKDYEASRSNLKPLGKRNSFKIKTKSTPSMSSSKKSNSCSQNIPTPNPPENN